MKELTIDDVYDSIGHLGFGQALYMLIVCSLGILSPFHMVLNIFTGLEPDFDCIPGSSLNSNDVSNSTSSQGVKINSPEINNGFITILSSTASPMDSKAIAERALLANHSFNITPNDEHKSEITPKRPHTTNAPKVTSTYSILHDRCPDNDPAQCVLLYQSSFKSFAQEWGLVCNKKYAVALVQSMWMGGVLAGALLLAGLPDIYGRFNTLILALIGTTALTGLSSFVQLYTVYVMLRFLGGMLFAIVILASFVFSQEIVGGSKRSLVGMLQTLAFALGIALLPLVASFTSDWRTLTLLASSLGVPVILMLFCLPESPRWLVSCDRTSDAQAVLESMARLNGTQDRLPPQWRLVADCHKTSMPQAQPTKKRSIRKFIGKLEQKGARLLNLEEKRVGLRALVQHGYIVRIVVVQIYSWFVNSAVYYGLTLAASDIGSNVYVSTALSGLVEVPAVIVALPLIERIGRRATLVSSMVCGGVSCLLMLLCRAGSVPYMVLALLGKLCIAASFSIAYIHSGEIFPTCVRNTGLGIVSVAARVGGIICPFLLMLGGLFPDLQYIVLGLLGLTSGLLNLLLPETLGRTMPETVQDVLDLRYEANLDANASKLRYCKLGEDPSSENESDEEVVELDRIGRK
ncbi:solute carrier family 22 member 15-like [Hyalella azteca]|uniref:Solute carrier family 22 member 15-like n=1 Tax=Hyalella azteca TaxID=294128 RepID=A0A8B7P162_HYAAZ|nr:solute carrier family 22 member 15-like [Hyalella azteca]